MTGIVKGRILEILSIIDENLLLGLLPELRRNLI
jgi:hypothetical protein